MRWRCTSCGREPLADDGTRWTCTGCGEGGSLVDGVWSVRPDFRPARFALRRQRALAALGDDHFWAAGRRRLLLLRLTDALDAGAPAGAAPADRTGPPRLGDLGCGGGALAAELAGRGWSVTGIDGHPEALAAAVRRDAPVRWVHADLHSTPLVGGELDAVLALDVLEHVEPTTFLREAARIVRPGGGLLVAVPASPQLWSRLDEAAGHRCRYTVERLRRELTEAGWRTLSWTHYQCLLYPLVWVSRRLGRRREVALERRHPRILGALLGVVNRFEASCLGRRRLPWGSSLIAWAVRP